jgi:hypothetical protein
LLVSRHRNEELPIFDIIIPPRLLDDPGQAAGGESLRRRCFERIAYAPRSPAHTGRLRPGFPPVATVAGQSTSPDAMLVATVAAPDRSAKDKARDQYRRPVESLTFWG